MVQLPTADNSLRRRLPQAGMSVVEVADGSAIARGAQNLGAGLTNLGQGLGQRALIEGREAKQEAAKTNAISEADRLNQFNSQMSSFEDTLKTDTDYGTQPKRFDDTFAKTKDTLLSGITDPYEKEQARVKFDALGISYKNRLETSVQAGQRDTARAATNKVVNDGLEIASKPGVDPVVHDQTLIATQNALKDARDKGVISAQEYEAQNREFTDRYRERRFDQKMDGKRTELLTGKPPVVGGGSATGAIAADGTDGEADTAAPVPSGGRSRSDEIKYRSSVALSHFMEKGYTKEQAAGIIGNLVQESSLRTNARNKGDGSDGSDSIGVAQWNGDRARALRSFAQEQGKDPDDFKTQLDFIDHELKTTEGAAGSKLRNAKTVDEAAAAMAGYERPKGWSENNPTGADGWANRLQHARLAAGQDPQSGEGRISDGASAPAATRPWTPKDDPDYLTLPYAARERVDRQWESDVREIGMQKRVGIETAIDNAPDAIQQTGSYTGALPSKEDFATAYGPEEGLRKADAFEAAVDTAKTVYGMQSMPNAEIQRTLEAARPTSTGDDAALEGKRYTALQGAATAVLAARQKDPAAYVMQALPSVRAAWDGVTPGSAEYAAAIRMTTDAQRSLGIPSGSIQPLPDMAAKSVVDIVKDATVPAAERLQTITSSVFATKDPEQQQAIFRQMVKQGAPAELAGVMAATARGDQAAATHLFQAATSDPEKLPGQLPNKPAEIEAQIQSDLMTPGRLGDAVYGLARNTQDSADMAVRDAPLIKKSVQTYLREGLNLSDAVARTAKDMWGDVSVYQGGYGVAASAVVPRGTDSFTLSKGLSSALERTFRPAVEQAAYATLGGMNSQDAGARSVAEKVVAQAVPALLDAASFHTFAPGRIGLVDDLSGHYYRGQDGQPLTISIDDALKMGRETGGTRAIGPRAAGSIAQPRTGVR